MLEETSELLTYDQGLFFDEEDFSTFAVEHLELYGDEC